jgi:SAM-dependent methyltransferase
MLESSTTKAAGGAGADTRPAFAMDPRLLTLLRCPSCSGEMTDIGSAEGTQIVCVACHRTVPVAGGVPRFVDVLLNPTARRTQASFGYEWSHFNDWRQSGETNFNDYFGGVDLSGLRRQVLLDAGCGMGRHARQVAPFAERVVAVDFSAAIDQAARNVAGLGNVHCVQADLLALPLADGAFDFVYSMGVLHHLSDTERALAELVRKLRPGGRIRVYLYWKRHGWRGRVLSIVTAARRITTRMPFPLLRLSSWILSIGLHVAVVRPYRALSALGINIHADWPLFVYVRYPFSVLYNDQFDRFSAPIEKRYDPEEVRALLESAGLRDVRIRPCFGWIADAVKP